ncbi:TPA: hypothetical protein DCW54_03475 [Candidatus Dependentiae bacterium]|nr:hypothetical protein [Candidatus Dependentiae bacterium]
MNINSYLLQLEQKKFSGRQVVAYSARGYPISFYHHLAAHTAHALGLPLRIFAGDNIEELIGSLSMSFLGSAFLFFIPDIACFSASARKKLDAFLSDYHGEHPVILGNSGGVWVPSYVSFLVEFEEKLSADEANALARLFFPQVWSASEQAMRFTRPVLLGDFIALSFARALSMGISSAAFDDYTVRITTNEGSVFSLAQFWLAKDMSKFGELWRVMGSSYPVEYWVSFFSDLLWQAAYCVQQGGRSLERALSNRLPFSFAKRDWRAYEVRELAAAHAYLYALDWQNKHGGSIQQLDLFIVKFSSGGFAR